MLRPWIAQVRSETNKKKTNEYYGNSRENGEAGNQHKSIKRALCVCNNLNIFVRPYLILLFITRMQTQLYIENHLLWDGWLEIQVDLETPNRRTPTVRIMWN